MKVLVVDNSSTMRRIIINALKQFIKDLEIVEAEDGNIGLQKLEEHNNVFDLILTDWNMPNCDGHQFLRTAISSGVTTPIIMVTTEAEKKNVVMAIKAGAKNYVTKPFTPATLKAKIEQTLGSNK